MHRGLVDEGHEIGRHRTARLMRANQLIARQKRRFKRTTDREHVWPVTPNLVCQDFTADAPDRKWGADISYIWTAEGWLYLAVVLDLFSRRAIGWATSDRLKRDLAVKALRRALVVRNLAPGLVHHSDRGSQYRSVDYQALLRKHGVLISLSAIACNRLSAVDGVGAGTATTTRWWKRSSKPSSRSQSGRSPGNLACRPKTPSPDTSTGSITPSDGIHRSASKTPSSTRKRHE